MKNSEWNLRQAAPATSTLGRERGEQGRAGTMDRAREPFLPEGAGLGPLLGLDHLAALEPVLQKALLEPIAELTTNRGKRVRGRLVTLSCNLLTPESTLSAAASKSCRIASQAVEFIHAGSLIVDDIEDGSRMRRGRPALHVRYGLPLALNAGNWLYFWPFELLKQLNVDDKRLLLIHDHCHRTLLRAHFGQAIDLGSRVDRLPRDQVADICVASLRLKTGALMGFAALLGAALAGGSERLLAIIDEFGRDLGVALQMFDDLGNAIGQCEPSKRFEDLSLSRPSWVWACAAKESSSADYESFLQAVGKLPDTVALERWIEAHDLFTVTRKSARACLGRAFDKLEFRLKNVGGPWSKRALGELRGLGEEVAVAYG